jgi:serine/threonine-protein kinase
VLFTDGALQGDDDVWRQPLDGGAARPYITGPGNQRTARVSPDSRWVAYESDETGHLEVYVQSYPVPGWKTLVSVGGGTHPVWARTGRELYYWQGEQLIAASLDAGGASKAPVVRARKPLFRAPRVELSGYDVSPDGTRFAFVSGGPRANRLVVVLDALGPDRPPGSGRR